MEALRRFNSRRTAPSFRALVNAGPPTGWLVLATLSGIAVSVAFFVLGVRDPIVLLGLPLGVIVLACAADREGWTIRMASAELAALQRERWPYGRLPADPASAEAWLAAYSDAPHLYRASMLLTAGRAQEAQALLAASIAEMPEDVVRLARVRATVDAAAGPQRLDRATIESLRHIPELADVSHEERRFHKLSLAWSAAWLEIKANRPWRAQFLADVRDLGPFRPPMRYRAFHASQQFALPIAYVVSMLIVSWLGLNPLLA